MEQCPVSGDRCQDILGECTQKNIKCLLLARSLANVIKDDILGRLDPSNPTDAKWLALGQTLQERAQSMTEKIAMSLGLEYDLFRAEVEDAMRDTPGSGFDIAGLIK